MNRKTFHKMYQKILSDITCHRFKLLTGQEMDKMHHCAVGSREAHDDLTFQKTGQLGNKYKETNKQAKNYYFYSKIFRADLLYIRILLFIC